MIKKSNFFILIVALTSSSCSFHRTHYDVTGHYKVGNSYTVNGITYYPKHYNNHEEVGVASWYSGIDYNSNGIVLTANGEIFNGDLISAAHKTLPLPCFVLVTNLKNGKQLIVRVNDRGPFISGRIIDLSEKAAKILGFHKDGLTMVKIIYLKKMSRKLIQGNPHYKRQYEKEIERYHIKQKNEESRGYIAFFENVNSAKTSASKLRSQGIKNVRLFFKNEIYCVKVNYVSYSSNSNISNM